MLLRVPAPEGGDDGPVRGEDAGGVMDMEWPAVAARKVRTPHMPFIILIYRQ